MTTEKNKPLIPARPLGSLQVTSGAARVVSTVVSDALNIATSKAQKLTTIGGYEFNEESCKQLEIWADEIIINGKSGISVEELVQRLDANTEGDSWVSEGWIVVSSFDDSSKWKNQKIDLSHTPALTELDCRSNQLTELDLSHTPALTTLECSVNPLTELDLSHTPVLANLDCKDNQLTTLDIKNNRQIKYVEADEFVKIIKHDWQLPDE